jgi:hypothetical protein
MRGGFKFNEGSENTVNVSLEINPAHYSQNGDSVTLTSVAILVGYQHL